MTWEPKPSLTRTNEEIKIRVSKSVRRKPALLGDLCIRKHFASDTKVASEDDVVMNSRACVHVCRQCGAEKSGSYRKRNIAHHTHLTSRTR